MTTLTPRRNPGPSWGIRFVDTLDRVLPAFLFLPIRRLGTWIAVLVLKRQRRASREYLSLLWGRAPRLVEIWRHFSEFEEMLVVKLRLARGFQFPCVYPPGSEAFVHWLQTGEPILIGTMHVGTSDMLGFQLGEYINNRVHMVRLRVENSGDIDTLLKRTGDRLRIIWVNEPSEMIFALKEAAQEPGAIVMQCDRVEGSQRTGVFRFLGAQRVFPTSIYYLAIVFQRPVLFTVGFRDKSNSWLHSSSLFTVTPGERREQTLSRAQAHFQSFLDDVERLLHQNPFAWFNFLPMNKAVSEETTR